MHVMNANGGESPDLEDVMNGNGGESPDLEDVITGMVGNLQTLKMQ